MPDGRVVTPIRFGCQSVSSGCWVRWPQAAGPFFMGPLLVCMLRWQNGRRIEGGTHMTHAIQSGTQHIRFWLMVAACWLTVVAWLPTQVEAASGVRAPDGLAVAAAANGAASGGKAHKPKKAKPTKKTKPVVQPDRTPSGETVTDRERRLMRECKGRPNAGACLGYAS